LELKASGLRGNGSFFNIVSEVLEIEVPYLLAMGKFIGAQMSDYRWYWWAELSRSYESRAHQPGWKVVTNDWNFWQMFGKSLFWRRLSEG
jgi:hypothetical protein